MKPVSRARWAAGLLLALVVAGVHGEQVEFASLDVARGSLRMYFDPSRSHREPPWWRSMAAVACMESMAG